MSDRENFVGKNTNEVAGASGTSGKGRSKPKPPGENNGGAGPGKDIVNQNAGKGSKKPGGGNGMPGAGKGGSGPGKKNSKAGLYFFIAVLIIYGIVMVFDMPLVMKAIGFFIRIIMQVAPVLALVFVLLFVVDLVIKPDKIIRYLGKDSGVVGWVVAVVGGIISSGPIYVWYPFLQDLREKGMRTGLAGTFLYNRAIKVPLMPLMIYYFGALFTAVLTVYMLVFSVLCGYIVEWFTDSE